MLASTSSLKSHNILLAVAQYSTGSGTTAPGCVPGKFGIYKNVGLP